MLKLDTGDLLVACVRLMSRLVKKPASLKPGDVIRVVASSSPFDKKSFLNGVAVLETLGFAVKFQKNIFHRIPYLAGSDERRARELIAALNDTEAKAILFARGGYGSMRLLPHLDKMRVPQRPKIVLGYSDVTSLLTYIHERFRWVCFYGPGVAKDLNQQMPAKTRTSLREALTTTKPLGTFLFPKAHTVHAGRVTAPVVGGCLSLIATLVGTPYELATENKILFLEDVGEAPYEIDRLLTHLKLAGKFKNCRGLVFGSLNGPNPLKHYVHTIKDLTKEFDFPVLVGIDVGHSAIKHTIPLGVKTCLDAKNKSLTFLERALA